MTNKGNVILSVGLKVQERFECWQQQWYFIVFV